MPHADKDVRKAYMKEYWKKNKAALSEKQKVWHADNREDVLKKQRVYRSNPDKRMMAIAAVCIHRAKHKGWAYEPKLGAILAANPPVDCPCCGKVFDYPGTVGAYGTKSRGIDDSPSIDRKDSGKGYTLDNIQLICGKCNRLKSNATISELETVLRFMKRGLN